MGRGLRGSTWCRCPGTERRLACSRAAVGGVGGREEGIFESPGSAGSGDTVYRWIGLNWATGKGAESRDGAWGSSTHTALREAN